MSNQMHHSRRRAPLHGMTRSVPIRHRAAVLHQRRLQVTAGVTNGSEGHQVTAAASTGHVSPGWRREIGWRFLAEKTLA